MGFLDKLKGAREMYQQGVAGAEHWARITAVGSGAIGTTTLELEIHEGGRRAYSVSTSVYPPKGVTPQVGQDVDFRTVVGDDRTHYDVEWDKPPRYGPGKDPSISTDPLGRLLGRATSGAPAGPEAEAAKVQLARTMLAKGLMSQADFDRLVAGGDLPPATPST